MIISFQQFQQQAEVITSLLARLPEHLAVDPRQNTSETRSKDDTNLDIVSLDSWYLQKDTDEITKNVVYMVHPFVLRSHRRRGYGAQTSNSEHPDITQQGQALSSIRHDQDNEYFDEYSDPDANESVKEILEDPHSLDTFLGENSHEFKHDDNDKSVNQYITMEWSFSIVYHETWGVPVLYFQVQYLDGSRCSRHDVLDALHVYDLNTSDAGLNITVGAVDSWDFISEEEHPITGIPSFFLHPCQTSARLEWMLEAMKQDAATPMDGINNDIHEDRRRGCEYHHDYLLLMWMMMIFPAVRCKIGIKVFDYVRKNLNTS